MNGINTRQFKPFECEILNEYALVHFGVVVCPSLNSLETTIIPSTESENEEGSRSLVPIQRDGEQGFVNTNRIPITGTGVIYLELSLSNSFYQSGMNQYSDAILGKNAEKMENYVSKNFSENAVSEFLYEVYGASILKPYFSPLVNLSPTVTSAIIKYTELEPSSIEDSDLFNFISIDMKKNIPIAIVDSARIGSKTQLISNDYFFSFPSLWNVESADFFLEPDE